MLEHALPIMPLRHLKNVHFAVEMSAIAVKSQHGWLLTPTYPP